MGVVARINEGSTGTYSFDLISESGAPLTGLPFSAARLRFIALPSLTVINSRNGQNILNNVLVPEITINSSGVLTWKLLEADTTVVTTPRTRQVIHRAEFVFEWTSGGIARQITHQADFAIRTLSNPPLS